MFVDRLRDNAELRALEPWHAEEFLAHLDRARTTMAPWVGASFVASDPAGARSVLQRFVDGQAVDRQRLFGIWLDDALVGGTMFVSFDAAGGTCEIGCWLESGAEDQELATDAVRRMINWAFRVRGLSRAEWRTRPDDTHSNAVAKTLGMSLDGTPAQVGTGDDGLRHDVQVWSVVSSDWPESTPTVATTAAVKAELDELMRAFLGAFTNIGGGQPNIQIIREVFIPQGMIISNVGAEPVIYDLEAFIAPRERILTDGTLTGFSEWEVAERTEIFGSIAHRFSNYRKSGFHNGQWFEGSGHKTTQYVRTPAGWRISSMAWDDI